MKMMQAAQVRATEQQRLFKNGQGQGPLNDDSGSDEDDLAAHEKKHRKIFDDDDDENSGEQGSSDLSSG